MVHPLQKSVLKKKIFHIFPAGSGNNVLYINAIKNALDPYFMQTIFVSASSPLKTFGYKLWFHPFTDLLRSQKQNKIFNTARYALRYIEFLICFTGIWFKCFFERPHYLNLSTATLLRTEYYFIKAVKILGVKPIYTIHDAQPFEVGYKRMSLLKLEKFYNLFSYVIVHNDLSGNFVKEKFHLQESTFLQFPFPPMDLKELKKTPAVTTGASRNFLFIGAFKKEKGYDDLINAWKLMTKEEVINSANKLTLAGVLPQGVNSLIDAGDTVPNMEIVSKYLSDNEFIDLLIKADVVVLPYRIGTNSGVLSTAMSLGKIIICSDIPSLKFHPLILEENIFPAGNIQALKNKIKTIINYSDPSLQKKKINALARFEQYKTRFETEAVSAFNKLIN